MPYDRHRSRPRGDPGRRGEVQHQPGGTKTLGLIQHEDQGTRQLIRLANGAGGTGMTGARLAHIHALDQASNPDGERQLTGDIP